LAASEAAHDLALAAVGLGVVFATGRGRRECRGDPERHGHIHDVVVLRRAYLRNVPDFGGHEPVERTGMTCVSRVDWLPLTASV
jgi:hypothetical protein